MPMVHTHAAATPEDVCKDRVRKFGVITCHLQAIVVW